MKNSLPAPSLRPGRLTPLVLGLAMLACACGPVSQVRGQEMQRHAIYEQAKAASLDMLILGVHGGSAVIVDPSGLVLTAAHGLLGNPERLELIDSDGVHHNVHIVAIDLRHDLALLQLPEREGGYPTVPIASEQPQAGDDMYLYGSPMFRPGMMQRGMAAHDGTAYEYYPDLNSYVEQVYVSGSAQPGTSGGPWLNSNGELVGIQLSIMSNHGTCVGVSMMAPLAALRELVDKREFVPIPTLGAAYEHMWEHPPEITGRYPAGSQGLVLRRVDETGTAAGAGLEDWDLIEAINGQPLQRPGDLAAVLAVQESDTSITLTVCSPGDNEPREVEVPMTWLQINWNTPVDDSSRNRPERQPQEEPDEEAEAEPDDEPRVENEPEAENAPEEEAEPAAP